VWNFHPNYVAAIFSLIGLSIILRQLFTDASQFADQKPNTFLNWIKSFPTGKPTSLSEEGGVSPTSILTLRWMTPFPEANATTDTKVEFLLKRVKNLQDEILDFDSHIGRLDAALFNKTQELNTNIENLNKSLKTIIASHPVGVYDVNLFGIVILICGTLIQLFYSLRA
jgi:predicted PolB exonuclease-like 3'-5' exonuclease